MEKVLYEMAGQNTLPIIYINQQLLLEGLQDLKALAASAELEIMKSKL